MPSIIYIYPPPSPVRKMPRNVKMSEVIPSPWACIKCRKIAKTYADGVVFCEHCKRKLLDNDKVNVSRGRQRNTPTPAWTKLRTE